MIESVRHIYERSRLDDRNGSTDDPLELGIYCLTPEQQKTIRE